MIPISIDVMCYWKFLLLGVIRMRLIVGIAVTPLGSVSLLGLRIRTEFIDNQIQLYLGRRSDSDSRNHCRLCRVSCVSWRAWTSWHAFGEGDHQNIVITVACLDILLIPVLRSLTVHDNRSTSSCSDRILRRSLGSFQAADKT